MLGNKSSTNYELNYLQYDEVSKISGVLMTGPVRATHRLNHEMIISMSYPQSCLKCLN